MKTNYLKSLFLASKSDLVSSPVLTNKPVDDYTLLLGSLYYESGVSKKVFFEVYIKTAQEYFTHANKSANESELFPIIKSAMRKRRGYYLPDGVVPEDVHSQRDVWTFATFLTGLLLPLKSPDLEPVLDKILSKECKLWLVNKAVINSILSLSEGNKLDANGEILCSFYEKEHIKEKAENTSCETEEKKQDEDKEQNETLTNKEVGELCLAWLYEQAKTKNDICYIKEEQLFIKSPGAFISYGKETKRSWKSIQKGVIKLGRHLPNPENNTPFIKIENKNMIVIV